MSIYISSAHASHLDHAFNCEGSFSGDFDLECDFRRDCVLQFSCSDPTESVVEMPYKDREMRENRLRNDTYLCSESLSIYIYSVLWEIKLRYKSLKGFQRIFLVLERSHGYRTHNRPGRCRRHRPSVAIFVIWIRSLLCGGPDRWR